MMDECRRTVMDIHWLVNSSSSSFCSLFSSNTISNWHFWTSWPVTGCPLYISAGRRSSRRAERCRPLYSVLGTAQACASSSTTAAAALLCIGHMTTRWRATDVICRHIYRRVCRCLSVYLLMVRRRRMCHSNAENDHLRCVKVKHIRPSVDRTDPFIIHSVISYSPTVQIFQK